MIYIYMFNIEYLAFSRVTQNTIQKPWFSSRRNHIFGTMNHGSAFKKKRWDW